MINYPRYPEYPHVKATYNNMFILSQPYIIKGVLIPKGFKSDGLTLKARVLRLVVSKYSPKFMPFYFIHDYLCDKEEYKKADDLGQEVLFEIEKSWRTKAMISMVKWYHRFAYDVK